MAVTLLIIIQFYLLLAGRGFAAPAPYPDLSPRAVNTCQPGACFKTADNEYYKDHITLDFRNGKPAKYDGFFMALNVDGYAAGQVQNQMSSANVIFNKDHLQLRTKKTGGKQQSASIESKDTVMYGSFRSRLSVDGPAGGVGGFFTFKDGGKNELDIEILTTDPKNKINYCNHITRGNGEQNPHSAPTFQGNWNRFHTHRFDWTDKASTFYVDKAKTATIDNGMPTEASTLILNMWSFGEGWGGVMKEGGEANMRVQWVQAFYNGADKSSCPSTCDIG